LISLRNGFSFVANFLVLTIALLIFVIIQNQIWQFRVLGIIIVGLGACTSLFYIAVLKEPHLTQEAKQLQKDFKDKQMGLYHKEKQEKLARRSMLSLTLKYWYNWLSEGQFYLYGMVYMIVRIAVNITMSVQPFYLIEVTGFK